MKKLISSLLISILILASCVVSNAANVANLSFTSSSTSVEVDSEITIYLEVNGISGIDELYGLGGVLSYDTDTFELVSITSEGSWKLSQGNIISMISDNSVTSGRIIKVVLKAIKKPDNGSSVLSLTRVSVTDNRNDYDQSDVTYTINVKDKVVTPEPEPNPDPDPEPNPEPEPDPTPENTTPTPAPVQNTTNPQNQVTSGNVTNDTTVSKVKLPAAGLNITIAILIILGVVIGTASFLRYKKIKLK